MTSLLNSLVKTVHDQVETLLKEELKDFLEPDKATLVITNVLSKLKLEPKKKTIQVPQDKNSGCVVILQSGNRKGQRCSETIKEKDYCYRHDPNRKKPEKKKKEKHEAEKPIETINKVVNGH
jgi:hypothetical protein